MNRRYFLKLGAASALGAAFPFHRFAFASSLPQLPIPSLLKADNAGRVRLRIQAGQRLWRRTPTRTWGINGPLLGPAVSVRRGQKVTIEVANELDEETAIHWHGLEIPGTVDGGPQAAIAPGGVWKPEIDIDQRAATCWFHPHTHGHTGRQVAMGLGGLLLIDDEVSDSLPLPKQWGVNDIPVVIQDKRLDATDQIDYAVDTMSAAVGWFGDLLLANGIPYPEHVAPRGWLRLRFLNACNARSLRLAASDRRPMHVIASDGGFLHEPVTVTELPVFTGERFEVLIDLGDGNPFDIVTLPVKQMGMTVPPFDRPVPVVRIMPSSGKGDGKLPDRLVSLPPLPDMGKLPVRTLRLSMDPRLDQLGMQELMRRHGHGAMAGMSMDGHAPPAQGHETMDMGHGAAATGPGREELNIRHSNFINGRAFVMDDPMFSVKQGQYERWVISGEGDMMLHPFHIHGAQFRILSENGAPPSPHRSGLKDTVVVEGKRSEVLIRFDHPAPGERAFMAHCHLLEHEDTGMMLSFTVFP